MLNEYDLRQIKLIKDNILLFESKKIELTDLINNLIGILNSLETIPNPWKNDFRTEINSLEMVEDSIEDGSIHRWKGDFKEDIHASILALKKMTTLLLEDYLKLPDTRVLDSAIQANNNWFICPKCNDAWKSDSQDAMVICPKCGSALHNPRATQKK